MSQLIVENVESIQSGGGGGWGVGGSVVPRLKSK